MCQPNAIRDLSMQYHFDGFKSGNPFVKPHKNLPSASKKNLDVLIIGCGPAGLTLAAQLAMYDHISAILVGRSSRDR